MKKLVTVLVLVTLNCFTALAQQTGDFSVSLQTQAGSKTYFIYVPPNYDPALSYPVITGYHGSGMNGDSYRALLKQTVNRRFTAIIICPTYTGGEGLSGFHDMVTVSLDWVESKYNVDPNKIVINGFSMGGNVCYPVGLEQVDRIGKVLSFNPAFGSQCGSGQTNMTDLSWTNLPKARIATIEGGSDMNFPYVDCLAKQMQEKNANLLYIVKPGVTHADNTYFNSQEFADDFYRGYLYVIGQMSPLAGFYADKTAACGSSLTVQFTDNSGNNPTSWKWDFGDGNTSSEQNPKHTYTSPGDYTVTLTATNEHGDNSATRTSYISLGTGEPYPAQKVGPPTNSFGQGGYFTANNIRGLVFDALQDMVIQSVKVYSGAAGERAIEILDASQKVIFSAKVNIPSGESRVDIGASVPKGSNYLIKIGSELVNLYRQNVGGNYPYKIDGLVSITKTNAEGTPTAATDYYYYFYDWEVRQVGCQTGTGINDETADDISIYPNPVNDMFNIELSGNQKEVGFKLYNMLGGVVCEKNFGNVNGRVRYQLDIHDLVPGNYLLYLKKGDEIFSQKLIKE